MKQYTDDQLEAVAKWLGFKLTFNESYGEKSWHWLSSTNKTFSSKDESGIWVHFRYWMRTKEGRVAIEDKFIEMDKHYLCRKLYVGKYVYFISRVADPDDYGDAGYVNLSVRSDTPAEAWLDAAIKASEVEG